MRHRLLFEHMQEGFSLNEIITDEDGKVVDFRILEANAAYERHTGSRPEDVIGRTIREILPAADPLQIERYGRVALTGEPLVFEYYSQAYGKHLRVRAFRPQPRRFATIFEDITEQRRSEALERENAARHRTILQTAMDGFWLTDAQGRLLDVNDAYCRMSGYSALELLAMRIPDLEAAENAEEAAAHMKRIAASGEARFESRHRRKDGSVFDVAVSVAYRPIDDGRFVVFVQDVTARKHSEAALKASGLRLREAQRVAGVGSWEQDLATGEVIWSESLYRMVGRDPAQPTPSYADLPRYYTSESWERLGAAVGRTVATGDGFELDLEVIREDGTHWWQTARGEAVRSPTGKIIRLQGTVLDISERRNAEEQREALQAQLNQARKLDSIGRLAGGVAHDFNNMLGVILGNAELALSSLATGAPWRAEFEEIRKAGESSARLTEQLLAFARRQFVSPKVLDLNDTLDGMLKMLRRLIGEDIDLAWVPGAGLWPVEMDPGQVDQLLANVCINARDALEDGGGIRVETRNVTLDAAFCSAHAEAVPGDYVSLVVSDTGRGMDEETRARIFEPFFTTKGVGEGTGLGLATVYGIVRQNGGLISVDSEPGHGTTFTIHLPRHLGDVEQSRENGAPAPVHGHETVLLVEDEPALLNVAKRVLEGFGYAVLAADTPLQAIRMAEQHAGEIHLLLTDVVMPGMNGWDLARNLSSSHPGMRCLLMSGHTAKDIPQRAKAEGMHFLQKPFSPKSLGAKVREALEGG